MQAKAGESPEDIKIKNDEAKDEWKNHAVPVFVELSPVCDVAQRGKRNAATLVAGLVVPDRFAPYIKSTGAFHVLANIFSTQGGWGFGSWRQKVVVVICAKFRATLPSKTEGAGLERWFRFRELPTAAMRTWLASQIARIGFVSL
ncbi:MAG: hypothetical protein IPL70_11015 [Uliginosibacterium sp.]|nr:hypothetical protein [Uliginosibacterium sp.]